MYHLLELWVKVVVTKLVSVNGNGYVKKVKTD